MAKLSAHGQNIQVEYLTHKTAVCSDGNILRNTGDGWKLHSRLKAGVSWQESAHTRKEKLAALLKDRPAYALYWRDLMRWKLSDRRRIMMTMNMLGDDTDGAWSELTSYSNRIDVDLEELETLARLKAAADREKESMTNPGETPPSLNVHPPTPARPSALDLF